MREWENVRAREKKETREKKSTTREQENQRTRDCVKGENERTRERGTEKTREQGNRRQEEKGNRKKGAKGKRRKPKKGRNETNTQYLHVRCVMMAPGRRISPRSKAPHEQLRQSHGSIHA